MTVTINGKEYGLHFGMKALETFYQTCGTVEEQSLFHTEQITAIVWGGLLNGAYRERRSLDLSFANVCDWVEAQFFIPEGQVLLTELTTAFNESQVVKGMAEMTQQEEIPKKKKRLTSPASDSSLSAA